MPDEKNRMAGLMASRFHRLAAPPPNAMHLVTPCAGVAVRCEDDALQAILQAGEIQPLAAGRAGSTPDAGRRRAGEDRHFGGPVVYGYLWRMGEPLGLPSFASAYGRTRIELAAPAWGEATFCIGDSLVEFDERDLVRHRPGDVSLDAAGNVVYPGARPYASRAVGYLEVQIPGSVPLRAIERVTLPASPGRQFGAELDRAGVPWTVQRGRTPYQWLRRL